MKGESPKAVYFFVAKKHVNTKPQIKNAFSSIELASHLFGRGRNVQWRLRIRPGRTRNVKWRGRIISGEVTGEWGKS